MKFAVAAICKNEAHNVEGWVASLEGDSYQTVVCDTGSTDGTPDEFRRVGLEVFRIRVLPFRFDDARNACLSLVDPDVDWVVWLDLDERLQPGWRDRLKAAINQTPNATRVRYTYVWDANAEVRDPANTFRADKIHARNGYRYIYPCHEALSHYGDEPEVYAGCDFEPLIEHHPGASENRNQYLKLLGLGARENPYDRRAHLYLLREHLFAQGKSSEVYALFARYSWSIGGRVEAKHALSMAWKFAKTEQDRLMCAGAQAFMSKVDAT